MEIGKKKLKNSKELDNLNILELEKNILILIFKDNVNYWFRLFINHQSIN